MQFLLRIAFEQTKEARAVLDALWKVGARRSKQAVPRNFGVLP